jgi:hypothetical protein
VLSRGVDAISRGVLSFFRFVASPLPAAVLVLVFMATFFVVGVVGLDFGTHWDEWYHGQVVASCIQRMSLLPDGLSYGGPYFSLGFPVVVAHQWKNLLDILREMRTMPARMDPSAFPSVAKFKAEATALLNTAEYTLQVRAVFLGVTTLAILWMYLACLRHQPRRWGAALAGAAFLAFSWELGYHARWLAIDAPLSQFSALELFFFVGAWRSASDGPTFRWYCAAAAAAGAVFACKLTGMFAVLPIVLLPLVRRSTWSWPRRIRMVVLGVALFVLVSFALSPAFYLDPIHLLNVFRSGSADYNSTTANYPHYVGVGEHVWRMLVWYFLAFPSPFLVVAAVFSAIGFIGLGSLLRRETRMTLSWLVFVVTFIGVFTHNHLLIVRQYLMCTPFWALCFARGVTVIWDFLRAREQRLAVAFAVAVVSGFAANGVFEAQQAWHVTRDTPETIAKAVAKDLLAHHGPVRMSRSVLELLKNKLGKAYVCHPASPKDTEIDHFLAYQIEHEWMANRLHSFRHAYGAPEVNLDYYSVWFGRSHSFRIVDVPLKTVESLARNMAVDVDCYPAGTPGASASQLAPRGMEAQASATYHEMFVPANAIDGFAISEWLLPDQTAGWLDVKLEKPRNIRAVKLTNGHNRNFHDRAIHDFRVEAYAGDRLITAKDGSFPPIDPHGTTTEIPLPADGVTRVRVVVKTWYGLGAALAEVELE